MSKIQPVVTRSKNTTRKEKTYDILSIQQYKEKAAMVQKILGKSDISNLKKGQKKKERRVGLHIEKRLNEGPRLQ